ncbi:MAG: hypothetical protein RL497_2603 [Pseudomonadota bacterium]
MFRKLTLFSLLASFSIGSFAEANRADYDMDNDGLIEINDLNDLNEIRNHLDGKALYGSNVGCPAAGCNGFELHGQLDFDTNQDGIFNAEDSYWNNGQGWKPLAPGGQLKFSARFDGNGNAIRNLVINRPDADVQSLFGVTQNASILNVGITGRLTKIVGARYVGSLVSKAYNTLFNGVFATGEVKAEMSETPVGGLIAYADGKSELRNSFTSVRVSGNTAQIGGLVGWSDGIKINAAYAIGAIYDGYYSIQTTPAPRTIGGLVGHSSSATPITNSYWAMDTTGQNTAGDQVLGGTGATLAQLKCAEAANNTSCIPGAVLYQGWTEQASVISAEPAWNIIAGLMPILALNIYSYMDSDADGILDFEDRWPTLYAASVDADGDGAPDFWHPSCDTHCQDASGLVLDAFPQYYNLADDKNNNGSPDAWSHYCNLICQERYIALGIKADIHDADKDGILDDRDTDDNNDKKLDADGDSNGLIDIHTLEELNAIRYDLSGAGRKLSSTGPGDTSGCPFKVTTEHTLIAQCHGYELKNNLDFDTNKNGKFDSGDTYWNEGKGWMPLSNLEQDFSGAFEGNGFAIQHLTILNPAISGGLFFEIRNALIRNLALIDFNLHIRSGGPLAKTMNDGQVKGIFTQGAVACNETESGNIGGLIGEVYGDEVSISNALIATDIKCAHSGYFGGLVSQGYGLEIRSNNTALLVLGQLNLITSNNGRKAAISAIAGEVSNTYWAIDATRQDEAGIKVTGATSATLAQLQCPRSANNTTCLPGTTLYQNWDKEKDSIGNVYWVFSNKGEIPALELLGARYTYKPKAQTPNQPPVVKLQLEQNGKVVTAANTSSLITLRAIISDPNSEDVQSLTWDYGKVYLSQNLVDGFVFDRQKPGKYTISVTVKDSGYPSLSSKAQLTFEYKEELNLIVDVKPVDPIKPIEPVKPSEPIKPVEPTKPATEKQAGSINLWLLCSLIGLIGLRIRRRSYVN